MLKTKENSIFAKHISSNVIVYFNGHPSLTRESIEYGRGIQITSNTLVDPKLLGKLVSFNYFHDCEHWEVITNE